MILLILLIPLISLNPSKRLKGINKLNSLGGLSLIPLASYPQFSIHSYALSGGSSQCQRLPCR